jgi:hypothetical protein
LYELMRIFGTDKNHFPSLVGADGYRTIQLYQ